VVYYNATTRELTYAPPTGGGGTANSISNGTSNVAITTSNGNINFNVNGISVGNISASSISLGNGAGGNGTDNRGF
jgi:hypothetical protein